MKSGFSFIIEVKDFDTFIERMKSHIIPNANNFRVDSGVMFNISDISAIYPLSAQYSVPPTKGGQWIDRFMPQLRRKI